MKRFLKTVACLACAPFIFFACEEEQQPGGAQSNTLSVTPSETISFEATGNTAVELTVTTDAESWDFTAPEWVTATAGETTLTVNAQDNTGASRVGRIQFTAGNAEPVSISVVQAAGSGEQPGGEGGASLKDSESEDVDVNLAVSFTSLAEMPAASVQVKLVLPEASAEDVTATITFDAAYLGEFILTHDDMDIELFPESGVTFSAETLTVPAGETESEPVTLNVDAAAAGVLSSTDYLIPVYVSEVTGAEIDADRVNYIFRRTLQKEVKNVVYFEVNDTNPLNALEYVLEDGTPFIDAVILFAGNINYNASEDQVYVSNNPNVTALLNATDVYLQPLREKGIKVYLGILGNHDAAGVCQLSDWGCEQFAAELANVCLQYKLDGVSFDDEYSSSPDTGNPWFASPSVYAGSRLSYETTKAMDELIPWETEVSWFIWGTMWGIEPIDGSQPGEFVDFWVANYGGASSPEDGMTMKQCSMMSIECNLGRGSIDERSARSGKESGYGWLMWFAMDPSGTGTISSNYWRFFPMMQGAARGLYDMEIQTPTGVYNKVGEGQYDPTRHPFNS